MGNMDTYRFHLYRQIHDNWMRFFVLFSLECGAYILHYSSDKKQLHQRRTIAPFLYRCILIFRSRNKFRLLKQSSRFCVVISIVIFIIDKVPVSQKICVKLFQFFCVLPWILGWLQCCRPTVLVFGNRVIGIFSPGILWGYPLGWKISFWTCIFRLFSNLWLQNWSVQRKPPSRSDKPKPPRTDAAEHGA